VWPIKMQVGVMLPEAIHDATPVQVMMVYRDGEDVAQPETHLWRRQIDLIHPIVSFSRVPPTPNDIHCGQMGGSHSMIRRHIYGWVASVNAAADLFRITRSAVLQPTHAPHSGIISIYLRWTGDPPSDLDMVIPVTIDWTLEMDTPIEGQDARTNDSGGRDRTGESTSQTTYVY
jgi:hypothetical protein